MKKRQKLNEKFNFLNNLANNVSVVRNDMSTRGGGVIIHDIFVKKQKHIEFSYFIDAVKPAALNILRGYNTSKKMQLKFILLWLNTDY